MTTDQFEVMTDGTGTAYTPDSTKWLVSSSQTGGTADDNHKGWVDLLSVSQPTILDGEVTDRCPILDV